MAPDAELIALHDQMGNRAVGQLIQTKLTIGALDDKYEREADRIAEQVMRIPDLQPLGRKITTNTPIPDMPRQCADCEDKFQRQAKEEEEKEEALIQPKASGGLSTRTLAFESERGGRAIQGAGVPLPETTRSFFEKCFGLDFSDVRIHADTNTGPLARQVNAKAFTLDRDIVFGAGQYSPETTEGKRLLAHELTHVVQQGSTGANSNAKSFDWETKDYKNRVNNLTHMQLLHVNTRRSRIQRAPDPPTREESERVALRFYAMAESASSVAQFQAAVEAAAATALGAIGTDALVFSLSGAGGYYIGAGGGFEIVYSPRFGWATYVQLGVGVSTPGASIALEVGVIWNLHNPLDYRGSFIELAGSYRNFSGSGFISPSSSPTGGIKVGGAIGSSGASLLYEYYWQLSGVAPPGVGHPAPASKYPVPIGPPPSLKEEQTKERPSESMPNAPPGRQQAISGDQVAHFEQLLNRGRGLLKRELGPIEGGFWFMNGVELQFYVSDPALFQHYDFHPVQWAGPEVIWVNYSDPATSTWQEYLRSEGTGPDGPEPQNVAISRKQGIIAYYDSPGPDISKHLDKRPSRIHVVQNFTGWVVGRLRAGGAAQRLSPVVAWHSVVSLVDRNWPDKAQMPKWARPQDGANHSGMGWVDTSKPPRI